MPNIFDLSKVIELTERERPVGIAVMDTNVLMNDPNPSNWKITSGPAIFVLSIGIIQELEFVKSKPNQESSKKAIETIRQIKSLISSGKIVEGIRIPGGWAIAIPSPKQDDLEKELSEIEEIVKAFKRSDAKLILLTRECSQQLTAPLILTAGEVNLYNILLGINDYN